MSFDGKVALVTGGARGQGRAIALALAREGCDIVMCDLVEQIDSAPYPMSRPEDLEESVAQVEALDRRCSATKVDLRDFDAVAAWVDAAREEFGRVDYLCCNAGITSYGQVSDIGLDVWHDMIDTNLNGVFHSIRATARHMIELGGGSIVCTASAFGRSAGSGFPHYIAAKWGVVGLVKAAALDLGPSNIRVNGVAPTAVNTPMLQNEFTWRAICPPDQEPTPEAFEKEFTSYHALPVPWVEPEDIANSYVFLHSEKARGISGTIIDVALGWNAKYTA